MSDVSILGHRLQVDPMRYMQKAADEHAGFAYTMYEPLIEEIREFQESLAANEEVGACLASFGQSVTIAVEHVSFRHPHLMIFEGIMEDGKHVRLAQHVSQVNLLLVPITVTDRPPRRIGFTVDESESTEPTDE